jgi:iron complex transport system substrate-binding protein
MLLLMIQLLGGIIIPENCLAQAANRANGASEASEVSGANGDKASTLRGPKIISLYAADTEILLRLGARDNLVGISRQETYAGTETEGWEKPPTFSIHDDVEKFLAANPDYIFLRPMHLSTNPNLFAALTKAGIKLWTRQCTKASDLYAFWREIAAIAERSAEVELMIADFQTKILALSHSNQDAISNQAAKSSDPPASPPASLPAIGSTSHTGLIEDKPGVFLESIHKEIKTFTPESIPIWLLTLAGGNNIAQDALAARVGLIIADYGPERLLMKAPEVDVYLSQEGPMNRTPLSDITGRDIFRTMPAVVNGRVYKVPEHLISRPTPSLLDGIRYMEACVRFGMPPEGGFAAAGDGGGE